MIVYHHFCFQCFLLCLTSFCVLFLVFPVSLDLTFLMSPMVLSNVVFFPDLFQSFSLIQIDFRARVLLDASVWEITHSLYICKISTYCNVVISRTISVQFRSISSVNERTLHCSHHESFILLTVHIMIT